MTRAFLTNLILSDLRRFRIEPFAVVTRRTSVNGYNVGMQGWKSGVGISKSHFLAGDGHRREKFMITNAHSRFLMRWEAKLPYSFASFVSQGGDGFDGDGAPGGQQGGDQGAYSEGEGGFAEDPGIETCHAVQLVGEGPSTEDGDGDADG
jgi:hypothetical protein